MSSERSMDPLGVAALVASGTLAAHQVGYLSDAEARAAHVYVAVAGPIVLLLALVAAWTAALRILRDDPGRAPRLTTLVVAQCGLYLTMELAERALGGNGYGSLWSAPAVLGLVAQPLVAWAALRLLAAGERVLRAFVADRPLPGAPERGRRPAPPAPLVARVPRAELRLRGPPVG